MVYGTDTEFLGRIRDLHPGRNVMATAGRIACMVFCCAMVLFLLAASASGETITARDKLGRELRIQVPVKRAVFFQTYELVPALDLWDQAVGIARFAYDNDLMKAAKPDIARTIPSAGGGTDINMEALMKLKPELVVTWTARPENITYMEQKGLKVYSIYPESIEELYEVIRFHGTVFNRKKRAQEVLAEMEKSFAMVRTRVAGIPVEKKRKVLWLGSRPTSVACAIGVNNDVINLIGGVNPAAVYQQRNVDVSMEQIIAWNPDVIFIWGNAKYSADDVMNNPQWRFVKAVRERRVFKAPEWSTWSPRLAPAVLWMAARTYPERFRDVNIGETADHFYRKVFGVPFSKVKGFAS